MARYVKSGTVNTVQEINSELEKIATAQDEFLTRNGEAPNEMKATLDMNSNRITNLRAPVSGTDAARLVDISGEYDITVGIDETPVFDNIAEMTSTNLAVGQLVRCKRYYSGGELVEGLVYEIQATQAVDGYVDHSLSNTNTAILLTSDSIDIQQAGVSELLTDNAERINACSLAYSLVTGSGLTLQLHNSITPTSNTEFDFTDVTLSANVSLGLNNMTDLSNGVSNVSFKGVTFNHNRDSFTADFSSVNKRNILNGFNNKNITIENCEFLNSAYRHILLDSNVEDGIDSITIKNCEFEGGARGGIFILRNGRDININENRLINTVDGVYGGISFEKSISVQGSDDVKILSNYVLQSNTSGSEIIVEQNDTTNLCNNVVISKNTIEYTGVLPQGLNNNIKAGATKNLIISENTCLNASATSVYLEGCEDVIITNNYLDGSQNNAIVLATDVSTAVSNTNVTISENIIKNCNQANNALGSTAGGISNESFAIYIRADNENTSIIDNVFATDGMNGILTAGNNYKIVGNDFYGIGASNVTIDNHFASTLTEWVIKNNLYASTRRTGRAIALSGASSIVVEPDILYEFGSTVINISNLSSFSGAVAYAIANPAGTNFSIIFRNSSHASSNLSADTTMFWEASTEYTANGIFGKTGI